MVMDNGVMKAWDGAGAWWRGINGGENGGHL